MTKPERKTKDKEQIADWLATQAWKYTDVVDMIEACVEDLNHKEWLEDLFHPVWDMVIKHYEKN